MLSEAINRHIELYRSMGFKYKVQAYMLHSFADFAQGRSEEFIQTDSVLEWAASAPSVRQRHDRLLTIRRLACALNAEDERHQVPPTDVFGRARRSRRTCHIFTQDEIDRLLRAASQLTPTGSIRPITYTALLSLITCTGLRVSEALKLELSDLTEDGLLIRATKFQKSRLVPLHESARRGLQQYVAVRKRYLIHDRDPLFTAEFLSMLAEVGVKSIKLLPRSPNLNAYAERFVRSIKESCLERMILFGEGSLRKGIQEFITHYHGERNHQGLGNRLIMPDEWHAGHRGAVRWRERLGGMLNYYYRAAA